MQVPEYLEKQDDLKKAGVDEVIVYCVNDGAVMTAWEESQGLKRGSSGSMFWKVGPPTCPQAKHTIFGSEGPANLFRLILLLGAACCSLPVAQGKPSMLTFLADTRSELTQALDMVLDDSGVMGALGNPRCKRFALVRDCCLSLPRFQNLAVCVAIEARKRATR